MSSENIKAESENVGKSILSPSSRNRTLLLKKSEFKDAGPKKVNSNQKVEDNDPGGGDQSPVIRVTPAKSVSSMQMAPKKGEQQSPPRKGTTKGDLLRSETRRDASLGKNTVVDITNSGLLGLSGRLREKKQVVPQAGVPKGGVGNGDGGKIELPKSAAPPPSVLTGSTVTGPKNIQSTSAKIANLASRINATKEVSVNAGDLDLARSRFVRTSKGGGENINSRSHLFGHEPATYTTNPLIIEDLIDELEEKAKNYFIMFSKERKEREKLERQCYWMQEENKTLQSTLKNQMTTIQGLQDKIIDLRGNPNVITETIERIDMLYTQLDTLIQAFAGICSYITFNEPTDRREIIELVLEYLHPCRGLDLRLNSLYGSIYYFKLGIIKDLPPPIQPPEKIPGYDVWQPPPPQKVQVKESDASKLPPHMQRGNSLSKVADNYMKSDGGASGLKVSSSDRGHDDDKAVPKISTPVASSSKQAVAPTSSSQLSGDINIPLSGFEVRIKSVQAIEPIGDGKGKLQFVARIDNEASVQCKSNPKRRSAEHEYTVNPTNNKGSIEKEMSMEIDALPPKSPGLLPRFTIDMWDSSITSGPIGHASKTFIDPYTLLPEQPWDVLKDDGEKQIATLIVTVLPKPGTSMLPAGRFIVAKESKNKEPSAKKENKLSRLSFRGDKESKGLDKINSMLRPALNIGKKKNASSDDKDKSEKPKESPPDLPKSVVAKPFVVKESLTAVTKSESVDGSGAAKSLSPPGGKEMPKSSSPEPDASSAPAPVQAPAPATPPVVAKKSSSDGPPPPPPPPPPKMADLKSSLKAPTGSVSSTGKAVDAPAPAQTEASELVSKDDSAKSDAPAPKFDLTRSGEVAAKQSGELTKSSLGDSKSMMPPPKKEGLRGEPSVNKSGPDPKDTPKQPAVNTEIHLEAKVTKPSPKITPKIAPKPIISKDPSSLNAPKAATQLPSPAATPLPTIVKKIDVKPAAIKPKIVAAPAINIKKPGGPPIQIKPKGIEFGKPGVVITPKLAVTPPKPSALGGGGPSAPPKEDIKIVVNKGAVNISPKIVPKVKITPKMKI